MRGQGTVDFVGGDVVKPAMVHIPSPLLQPKVPSCFEQREGANNIGVDKGGRSGNGAIHMGLSRAVDDRINVIVSQQSLHQLAIANRALHDLMAVRVGKCIKII